MTSEELKSSITQSDSDLESIGYIIECSNKLCVGACVHCALYMWKNLKFLLTLWNKGTRSYEGERWKVGMRQLTMGMFSRFHLLYLFIISSEWHRFCFHSVISFSPSLFFLHLSAVSFTNLLWIDVPPDMALLSVTLQMENEFERSVDSVCVCHYVCDWVRMFQFVCLFHFHKSYHHMKGFSVPTIGWLRHSQPADEKVNVCVFWELTENDS